jgi:hypothetical protein
MDLKRIYPGGEPKISNPDLMFTQYSNYYALQALATGLDDNGLGVIITGCQVGATYNSIDKVIAISLTDGFLSVGEQLVKVENTTSLVDVDVTFSQSTQSVYVYGTPTISYNALGDKTFNDSTFRQTWEETRIVLSSSQSITTPSGAIKIARIDVTNGSSIVNIVPIALNIQQNAISSNNAIDITTTTRNGKTNTIITPDVLYDVVGDYTNVKLISYAKIVDGNFNLYYFNLPSDTMDMFLLSSKVAVSGSTNWIGDSNTVTGNTWLYDYDTKVLVVNFTSTGTLAATANVLVAVNRITF